MQWIISLLQGSNLLNPCLKYPTPPQAFSGLLALTFSPAENAPPWIFGTCYFSNWSELIRIGKNLSELNRIWQNLYDPGAICKELESNFTIHHTDSAALINRSAMATAPSAHRHKANYFQFMSTDI